MKNILLLTDFSDTSQKAIEFAMHVYKGLTCSFTVLNCYIELPLATDQVDEAVEHNAQSRICAYVDELRQQAISDSFSFEGMAIGGNLAVAVTGIYEKNPFDLVVVGASGTGNSVRLGSTATEIIRAARYPVLVVPSSTQLVPVQNIAVATDYRNFRSVEVFEPIRELVDAGRKKLIFVSVLDTDSAGQEVDAEGKMLLNEYFKMYEPLHSSIRNDSPVEGIEKFIASHDTHLLVTVSRHHSLWDVLLNRSTSRILAYEAQVPLMVLIETVSDSSDNLPSPDWNVIL
jgi:nucleotide-binding universal stress UspA family protein